MIKIILKHLFILLLIIIYGCGDNLENLTESKRRIADYYEKGEYSEDLEKALSAAYDELENIKGENTAIVFDVDETILSNYNYIKSINFGYQKKHWDEYLMTATASPIAQTVEFYNKALEKGVSVIFLTARSEKTCQSTYTNLMEAGIQKFDTLICKNYEFESVSSREFKEIERKLLREKGYNIVMCIGDQESDLAGEYTGLKIKLPNKIYLIK